MITKNCIISALPQNQISAIENLRDCVGKLINTDRLPLDINLNFSSYDCNKKINQFRTDSDPESNFEARRHFIHVLPSCIKFL